MAATGFVITSCSTFYRPPVKESVFEREEQIKKGFLAEVQNIVGEDGERNVLLAAEGRSYHVYKIDVPSFYRLEIGDFVYIAGYDLVRCSHNIFDKKDVFDVLNIRTFIVREKK